MPINHQARLEACNRCASYCDYCAASCLEERNTDAMAACIHLNMECAPACRLAAQYLAQDSRFAAAVCELCARICEACGEECAQHEMEHCQQCAQACQACAQECRKMAA